MTHAPTPIRSKGVQAKRFGLHFAAWIGGLAALSACAHERPASFWYVHTNPEGAEVRTDQSHVCVTPCRLEIKRWTNEKATFQYSITKTGFEPVNGQARIGWNALLPAYVALAATTGLYVGDEKGDRVIVPNPLKIDLKAAAPPPAAPLAPEAPKDPPK